MPDAGQDTWDIGDTLPDSSDNSQTGLTPAADPGDPTLDLTEIKTLMQQTLDKQDEIIQHQQNLQDLNVIYYCIFIGLILGYLAIKGLTKPWK